MAIFNSYVKLLEHWRKLVKLPACDAEWRVAQCGLGCVGDFSAQSGSVSLWNLVVDLPQLGLLLLLLGLLLKDDLVSWDYDIPNMMEKYKIHVPNHQSDYVKCPFLEPVLSTSSLSRVAFQVSHNSSQETTRWTLPTLPTICENRGPFNRRV